MNRSFKWLILHTLAAPPLPAQKRTPALSIARLRSDKTL